MYHDSVSNGPIALGTRVWDPGMCMSGGTEVVKMKRIPNSTPSVPVYPAPGYTEACYQCSITGIRYRSRCTLLNNTEYSYGGRGGLIPLENPFGKRRERASISLDLDVMSVMFKCYKSVY